MSIASIIENRKGTAGPWRVARVVNREGSAMLDDVYQLWHYDTCMLEWCENDFGSTVTYTNIGHGSVSDQNGVNKAFAILGAGLRYRRDQAGGGPRIVILSPVENPAYQDFGAES